MQQALFCLRNTVESVWTVSTGSLLLLLVPKWGSIIFTKVTLRLLYTPFYLQEALVSCRPSPLRPFAAHSQWALPRGYQSPELLHQHGTNALQTLWLAPLTRCYSHNHLHCIFPLCPPAMSDDWDRCDIRCRCFNLSGIARDCDGKIAVYSSMWYVECLGPS